MLPLFATQAVRGRRARRRRAWCAVAALVVAAGGCGSGGLARATPQSLRAAYFAPMTDFERQDAAAVCNDLTPTSAAEFAIRVARALPGHPHTTCRAALRQWFAIVGKDAGGVVDAAPLLRHVTIGAIRRHGTAATAELGFDGEGYRLVHFEWLHGHWRLNAHAGVTGATRRRGQSVSSSATFYY